jgi:sugar O-acyltransferase (sialic acid O-acetyltransferase NeuD family)
MEEVIVPLLNANEPEARVVSVYVEELQYIKPGEKIFTIETTKATVDIESTSSGFIHLFVKVNDIVFVGNTIGLITDKRDSNFPKHTKEIRSDKSGDLRITEPARKLAKELKIDINEISSDKLVTKAVIEKISQKNLNFIIPEIGEPDESIIIYGGGGHAKAVIDMIRGKGEYQIIGIIDDNIPPGELVLDIPILGNWMILDKLHESGVIYAANSVGGIIDINIRIRIGELLEKKGYILPALIHPKATIENSSQTGHGVQVFANAYVGSDCWIGKHAIINTNAVVSHDCIIGAHSHISPGCLLAGLVQIGKASLIGMGVTTAIGVKIGDHCRIGNGAIIYADVPANTIIQGGKIWNG